MLRRISVTNALQTHGIVVQHRALSVPKKDRPELRYLGVAVGSEVSPDGHSECPFGYTEAPLSAATVTRREPSAAGSALARLGWSHGPRYGITICMVEPAQKAPQSSV